ncbi:hypothetical protein GA0070616_4581 [Micromonospora nigra]|uniref:Uncharacterized protein n=1 Tax=Micromonospora nigra TaxID=145857 RepID=A0A1C6STN8_9ACTN|nr:hypothetical protein [Micromonospora nigra]SCL32891.1 hypothetical protein GA0070616_4581 [Micromonospora nigra]
MAKPVIRVTLVRRRWVAWNGRTVAPETIVREFDDEARAASWFTEDSYFAEGYTESATWERLD